MSNDHGGMRGCPDPEPDRRPRWVAAILLVVALVALVLTGAMSSSAAAPPPPAGPPGHTSGPPGPPGGGGTPVSPPPGVVNDCPSNEIFYWFRYNDSATVGLDTGCSTGIDVYKTDVPTLIATYLHVSCSDKIDPTTGIPTKSDLGSSSRRVAAYYIEKPDGKTCGFGTSGQTIQGEIYRCVNGAPSTTLVSGGTIAVPTASLSSANPLAATQVDAGTYGMTATAPSGLMFVACGQTGVTITNPSSASQDVVVPSGGAGDGKFYVTDVTYGYIEVCKSSANGVSGMFRFVVNGATISVPAGACSPALRVPSGTQVIKELGATGYGMAGASTIPSSRLVSVDTANRTVTVTVPAGNVSTQTIVTVVNKPGKGTVKVCQIAGTGVAVGTKFSFTDSADGQIVQVPAGPSDGGYCNLLVGTFTGGTTLTITQSAPSGYTVTAIGVAPSSRLVGSPDPANKKVSFVVGSGVTEVTYTDVRSS